MNDIKITLTICFLLGFVSACASFEKAHPWGPGGSVWLDTIKSTGL